MSETIKLKDLKAEISGIYKLNYPNGKIYIGQSCDIKRRMYEHNNSNRLLNHPQSPCDLAIAKYGRFEEIEILDYAEIDSLNELEIYWIKYYNSNNKEIGYNLTPGGDSLLAEDHPKAVFRNEEVLDIRKRRFIGERKIEVYNQYYATKNFATFERIWLGRGYPQIGKEFIIPAHEISRQEYSSKANEGSNNGMAKLTEEKVREIRLRYDSGESISSIAKDFNCVNRNSIVRVCKRQTWKTVV